jgi:phosphohistidine phosphatase SixA
VNLKHRILSGLAAALIASAALPRTSQAEEQPGAPARCVEAVAAAAPAPPAAAPAPTRLTPVTNAAADSIPHAADSTLVRELKKGGYVIFFRHATTNWNERDGAEGDFSSRANQRNLTEAGQIQAAGIGFAFTALEIPIEKVLSSPMWRCRDTAQFAFGDYDTTSLLFWKGPTFREARIKMLSTPPAAGKNLVIVGHQDQFIPIVPGLRRDQLKEGDALVFQPLDKGKYRVVTQVTPADWARLSGQLTTPPQMGQRQEALPQFQDSLPPEKSEK